MYQWKKDPLKWLTDWKKKKRGSQKYKEKETMAYSLKPSANLKKLYLLWLLHTLYYCVAIVSAH